ncbi:flagellar basal body rod protein FlgB [Paenibacillus endoradicis]|uniref:flagellar basal body rod protein FlgB n=1 Tax=Paenibacillus endoradicis TaxID=2972487 RepID=UPI002159B5A2|nr:flagellar basal body rod protein FlgB [Paenibacillus endoradicis]MCR8656245.1 flagellar basal body rod protein FlgB [Paenibacillus endoradicis]
MKLLNSTSFQRMESALYNAEARQRVISNNIANAETPNFKRSELLFENIIADAMGENSTSSLKGQITNDRHIAINGGKLGLPTAKLVTDTTTAMNSTTNNNVDLDAEMTLQAKNQLNYNLYVQQLNHEFSMMRIAITGGK